MISHTSPKNLFEREQFFEILFFEMIKLFKFISISSFGEKLCGRLHIERENSKKQQWYKVFQRKYCWVKMILSRVQRADCKQAEKRSFECKDQLCLLAIIGNRF